MALKSGGAIPPRVTLVDANQTIALLNLMHFWSAKKVHRGGIEVNITQAGRRVSAQRKTLPEAAMAAMEKLRVKKGIPQESPIMRLVK